MVSSLLRTYYVPYAIFYTIYEMLKVLLKGFPGGTVVKKVPANAGDMGSSLGSGRIPHATEQLSPCATTTEPAL